MRKLTNKKIKWHQAAQQGNSSEGNSSSDENNAEKDLPAEKAVRRNWKPELKQAERKPKPIDKETEEIVPKVQAKSDTA